MVAHSSPAEYGVELRGVQRGLMAVAQVPNHLPADVVPRAIVAGAGVATADHKPVHVTTPGAAVGDQTL